MTTMILLFDDPAKLKTKQYALEEKYVTLDSATLEQLKELSSKLRLLEESIDETSSIAEAIAREMSGGLCTHLQQAVARRRAEEKGSTIGLLGKLHFGVCELLDQAASTLFAATRK